MHSLFVHRLQHSTPDEAAVFSVTISASQEDATKDCPLGGSMYTEHKVYPWEPSFGNTTGVRRALRALALTDVTSMLDARRVVEECPTEQRTACKEMIRRVERLATSWAMDDLDTLADLCVYITRQFIQRAPIDATY